LSLPREVNYLDPENKADLVETDFDFGWQARSGLSFVDFLAIFCRNTVSENSPWRRQVILPNNYLRFPSNYFGIPDQKHRPFWPEKPWDSILDCGGICLAICRGISADFSRRFS
jgi:hypothetical protein